MVFRSEHPYRYGNCLERSLVLCRYLSAAGSDPELLVGMRRGENELEGHAWVVKGPRCRGDSRVARGIWPGRRLSRRVGIAGARARHLSRASVIFPWYTFALLFLLPFVDPRRPFRLLHLDLVVLVGLGMGTLYPYAFEVQPRGTTVVAVVGLAYVAARLLYAGFRPAARAEPLIPLVPATWLVVGLLAVLGVRYAYIATDRQVAFDVGLASVAGADRIGDGDELYGEIAETGKYSDEGSFSHFDTYGPVTYLAYVPFEQVLPWGGGSVRRLRRPGRRTRRRDRPRSVRDRRPLPARAEDPPGGGRLLGLALAYAWASYPYTLFQPHYSFNDSLVALLVIGAFLALRSPQGRGLSSRSRD